jgi:predicted ATP-grasp superfamily ATP-dependent carboligase
VLHRVISRTGSMTKNPLPRPLSARGGLGRPSHVAFVTLPKAPRVRGALAVVAFPTAGLSGTIAARYLVQTLRMEPLGYLDGEDFEPAVCIEHGRASPCLRAFAAPASCGPEGRCNQLVVIYTDLSPPLGDLRPLASAVLRWAESSQIDSIVVLEGTPSLLNAADTDNTVDPPRAWSMANVRGEALLPHLKAEPMDGMVTGFAAALLVESLPEGFPLATLIVESQKDRPDARAAAVMVESLSLLLPQLNLDPRPLLNEAEKLEGAVRRSRSTVAQSRTASRPEAPSPGMYG